jgi:hypothetical protein
MEAREIRPWMSAGRMVPALLLAFSLSCHSGAKGNGGANAPSSATIDAAGGGPALVPLPGGTGGIGFDDLVFAPGIRKVLAPAGATVNLDLVDPDAMQVTVVPGFSGSRGSFKGGHGEGTTSADEGRGLLFATDRTTGQLNVVDPAAKARDGRRSRQRLGVRPGPRSAHRLQRRVSAKRQLTSCGTNRPCGRRFKAT